MIGWDAADWQILRPMIDKGWMPALESLIARGVHGNLSTLTPALSPILWNSIATGKRAYDHGILGFMEVNAEGTDVQPASSASRSTRALWNILTNQGYHTNVVSWFASHPAEPVSGVCVSDQFATVRVEDGERKPIPAGAIHPEQWHDRLAELRVELREIDFEDVSRFLAPGADIDPRRDNRQLQTIRKLIAEVSAVHGAATMIMEEEPWDFMGVYYQTLDLTKHHFMEYHPPRMAHVSQEDFDRYRDVITNMYRFHDLMLGRLLHLAGEDALVVLCSDHGFLNNHLRPKNSSPTDPKQAAGWHRYHGMFVMAGPNIAAGREVYGAGLLDILPTTLTALGLPVGADMEGRILLPVFEHAPHIGRIPTWDDAEGDFGEHPPGKRFSSLDAGEAMKQLVELGYLAEAPEDAKGRVATTERDMRMNLVGALVDGQRIYEAKSLLEELLSESPDDHRLLTALARCEEFLGNTSRAFEIASRIVDEHGQVPHAQLLVLKSRLEDAGEGGAEGLIDALLEDEALGPEQFNQAGQVLLNARDWAQAVRVFRRSLELDPDNAGACDGLALAHVKMRDYDNAADLALRAIGLAYDRPRAHVTLAWSLARTGRVLDAVDALHRAIELRPGWSRPSRMLAALMRRLGADELADLHERQAQQSDLISNEHIEIAKRGRGSARPAGAGRTEQTVRRDEPENGAAFVTVVSGLPRSGTSLMMQALAAGGLPALTDAQREADEDNPRGYFELESVKQISSDDSFLDGAPGKAVKLIHALVTHLPDRHDYRVIMMRRDLDEVLRSQSKMLDRSDRSGANLDPETLKETYRQQMDRACSWLDQRDNVRRLDVEYTALIDDPATEMERINRFLGGDLDPEAMAGAVDPTLYRNRRAPA